MNFLLDKLEIRNYAIAVIKETHNTDSIELFEKLFKNGLIDQERVLKGCINHYYDKQYKLNNCIMGDTVIDTSILFDISTSQVKNTIYKFRNVRLDF